MMTIYKYKLAPITDIPLPAGAKVLSVGAQGSDIVLWAQVDTDLVPRTVTRRFEGYGTGHPIADPLGLAFIGTAQMQNGLVFHIFERKPI